MATLQDVITRARHYLQDVVPPLRQEDAELELYLEDAFGEMYRTRPDIFPAGTDPCAVPIPTWTDLTEPFPLNLQWLNACALFVAGHALLKDDEHTENAHSGQILSLAFRAMGAANA